MKSHTRRAWRPPNFTLSMAHTNWQELGYKPAANTNFFTVKTAVSGCTGVPGRQKNKIKLAFKLVWIHLWSSQNISSFREFPVVPWAWHTLAPRTPQTNSCSIGTNQHVGQYHKRCGKNWAEHGSFGLVLSPDSEMCPVCVLLSTCSFVWIMYVENDFSLSLIPYCLQTHWLFHNSANVQRLVIQLVRHRGTCCKPYRIPMTLKHFRPMGIVRTGHDLLSGF